MDEPQETELKLEIDPAAVGQLFAGDPGVRQRLVSTYFDTPDRDLAQAGFTLRIRIEGEARIQTVKASAATAGLFVRPEWECAVDGDTPRLDPASGPLGELVGEAVLARIAPLFTTEVTRTVRTLAVDGATIEIACDDGMVRAGDRTAPLAEVELELKAGETPALFAFARRLEALAPARLGVRAKSERGYALAAGEAIRAVKAGPIALDPEGDTRDGFAAIAHACIRHFRLNETLLLETGAAEPLHQARVAIRRLRSAFSLFKRLFADDPRADELRAALKALAAELGEVRNLDVLIPKFDGATRATLEAARASRFDRVRLLLESAETRRLMLDLVEWLTLGDWRVRPADPDLAERHLRGFAADTLDRHRKRIKRSGSGLASLDDEDRHRVRIEGKTLRYAAEFFADLYVGGKKGRRRHAAFLDAIEALQDQLGELNDRVTGATVLGSLGIATAWPDAAPSPHKVLRKAEDAYDALIDLKRFWR